MTGCTGNEGDEEYCDDISLNHIHVLSKNVFEGAIAPAMPKVLQHKLSATILFEAWRDRAILPPVGCNK